MSNPYAPPEDRPREAPSGVALGGADAASAGAPGGQPGVSGGQPGVPGEEQPGVPDGPTTRPGATPDAGPVGIPDRSPAGVPYERPRSTVVQAPAPHPAAAHRLGVLVRSTALLVLVAVLADLLPFPWYVGGAPVALAALVVGGRALVLAARTSQRAPRAVLGLLLVVAVLGLARPGMALLTWQAESQYAQCQAGALTLQAQRSCVSDYQQALDDRAAQLTRRTP